MTLVIVVGTGIRLETGCTNDCCCTVIRPLEVAAMACICWVTQAVAAPMPRTGSVWLDAVCLVPNWVSRRMVAWIRSGSICSDQSPQSRVEFPVFWARPTGIGRCGAGRRGAASMGAAAAVTAEADRNARRVEPLGPKTCLFSIA